MSTLRVSNIEAKADPSSPSVDEKLKVTNSNGDVLIHIDGKTAGITTVGINTTDSSFTVDAAQNVEFLGIVTATKFSLSGGGEITGGDGNFTGIVTAASIDATTASFSGNVSIAGTLTYEDVTSIDSIGIVTSQSDVHVGAGLSVVGISTLANTNINGQLIVTNARITGITTFGTSSIAINGDLEYPIIRPTLDLNFAATKTLDRRITFTRDSIGTYTDDVGIVRYASNNVPRFDHDPTTGESLGLLIEESRTNDVAHSDPANAVWIIDNSSVKTANTTDTKAPDGSFTALKLASQATSPSYSQLYDTLNKSSGGVQSVWAKKGTHNVLGMYNFQGSGGIRGWFDLNTGEHRCEGGSKVAAGVQSNGNDTNNTNMVEYPNGWYRCMYYEAANMTYNYFRIVDFDSDGEASSASNTIYLWGAQAEVNKTFATSFIPSLSATMPATNSTRTQDTPLITGTNFTDFYNQSEGTLVLSADIGYTATSNQAAVVFEDTSSQSTDLIALGYRVGGGASGNLGGWYQGNGAAVTFKDHSVGVTVNSEFRQAFAYKTDDLASVVNGTTPLTDNSGTLSTSIDRVRFGEYYADGMTSGHIRQFKYYNKRLPNAQLQGLTQQ